MPVGPLVGIGPGPIPYIKNYNNLKRMFSPSVSIFIFKVMVGIIYSPNKKICRLNKISC